MIIEIEIMIGIAVGLSIGVSGGIFFVKNKEMDMRLEMLKTLKETRRMLLTRAVETTNCANAMVLRISNCGGKLEEGEEWFSSVVAESPEKMGVSAKNDWQNISVQDSYKELIRSVRQQKVVHIHTHTMQAGDLKTAYEAMGVIGSVVMELYSDDMYYYYMSFPVRVRWDEFTLSDDWYKVKKIHLQMQRKYKTCGVFGILEYDNL